jgi:hypothetical protein
MDKALRIQGQEILTKPILILHMVVLEWGEVLAEV